MKTNIGLIVAVDEFGHVYVTDDYFDSSQLEDFADGSGARTFEIHSLDLEVELVDPFQTYQTRYYHTHKENQR
jgi:hypothetical protein